MSIPNKQQIARAHRILSVNKRTGHLNECGSRNYPINRVVNGVKPYCYSIVKTANGTTQCCGSLVSKQSCLVDGKGFCSNPADHWGLLCSSNGWNREISRCANLIADQLNLDPKIRNSINQDNIEDILGIPSNRIYNHISDKVRRENYNDISDESSSSESDNLEDEDYNIGDSELEDNHSEYENSHSDEEDSD